MNVAVIGLSHLGAVTAACLERMGHRVVAYDQRPIFMNRAKTEPDTIEPGLWAFRADTLEFNANGGSCVFTGEAIALAACDVFWFCYDTPIDSDEKPDPEWVIKHICNLFPLMPKNSIVLISSQLPVGSTRRIMHCYSQYVRSPRVEQDNEGDLVLNHDNECKGDVTFMYVPENLVRGNAIHRFMDPDRIVIGTDGHNSAADAVDKVVSLFSSVVGEKGNLFLWMRLEDAEMVKHAINAFLATEISFINEIAEICKAVGADANAISLGLKTDKRIGQAAYLRPGGAYTSQTLGRDVHYLREIADNAGITPAVLHGISVRNGMERRRS